MSKDPMHIPYAELVVAYKGKEVLMLSKQLLDRQNCWENLDLIKKLHQDRLFVEEVMLTNKAKSVHLKRWTEIQFELQDAWGFPKNAKYHKFWTIPACTCPKLDNEDMYPTGHYIIAGDCPLHGATDD